MPVHCAVVTPCLGSCVVGITIPKLMQSHGVKTLLNAPSIKNAAISPCRAGGACFDAYSAFH
ncbi:hypothetical protein BT93_H2005 [Corymbia citriodora subsp. variegata]|nr:hypothetical protein BT93_H2005 [Corymbia citriodora subsp. variegata]